jgi:DNA repair exonuclease SbcCD nuclease subunit
MRFLITGDWHISLTKPEKRLDKDYFETVRIKLKTLIDSAIQTECDFILQPGDFFDSHKANDFLKRYMIKTLSHHKIKVLTVFGQHDLRFHSSDIRNTPLGVLQAAGVVHLAPNWEPLDFDGVHVYGASWFEDIPQELYDKKAFNILICHKMVLEEKLWDGQTDGVFGNVLLRTNPFDLIVSGDNHQHFTSKVGRRLLVNCGSLIRTRIDQFNHRPAFYIFDTDTLDLQLEYIPVEQPEKVFDLTKAETEKEQNAVLIAFVERLKKNVKLEGLDFTKNIKTYMEEHEEQIDNGTKGILEEVLN